MKLSVSRKISLNAEDVVTPDDGIENGPNFSLYFGLEPGRSIRTSGDGFCYRGGQCRRPGRRSAMPRRLIAALHQNRGARRARARAAPNTDRLR